MTFTQTHLKFNASNSLIGLIISKLMNSTTELFGLFVSQAQVFSSLGIITEL